MNLSNLIKKVLNILYNSFKGVIEAFLSLIKDLNITIYYIILVNIIDNFKARL